MNRPALGNQHREEIVMPLVILRDIEKDIEKKIDFPYGVAIPKAGEEVFSPVSGSRVVVSEIIESDMGLIEIRVNK